MACAAAVVLCAAVAPASAQESAQDLKKQIDALLQKAESEELTEAEMNQLDDLLDRYEKAVIAEQATDDDAQPQPTAAPAASPAPPRPRSHAIARPTPTPRPVSTHRPPVRRPSTSGTTATGRRRTSTARPRTPTPAQRSAAGQTPTADEAQAGAEGGKLETELNEAAEQFLKPYTERQYSFSIKDGTYAELIENFARMASLPVIGQAPPGTVTFVSREPMDFKSALGRIQMLLFEHPQQYWIQLNDEGILEISPVTELSRILKPEQIFPTLQEYRAANLDENDLALLLYRPESGSIADLEPLRDYMPDYVRIAQFGTENALAIFGLVRDINKYLELVEKIKVTGEDPRSLELIPIEHITPTEALQWLQSIMEGFGTPAGAPASTRRPGQTSVAAAQAEGIDAIPMDDYGTLLVRAMPAKIKEIKSLLTMLDRPLPQDSFKPVVVKVLNAKAGDILQLVQTLMASGQTTPGTSSVRRPSTRRRRGRAAVQAAPASASNDDLSMTEWPATNSIILMGSEEAVAEARELIERFDVPEELGTEIVPLTHANADDLVPLITQVLQGGGKGMPAGLLVQANSTGDSIIIGGSPNDIAKVKDLIAQLDVAPDGPADVIHDIRLKNMKPSSMIGILQAWEAQETGSAQPRRTVRRGRNRRARTQVSGGNKFQGDDATGWLYVICPDEEWEQTYKPLIERLDETGSATPEFAIISIENIEPEEAIAKLQAAIGVKGQRGAAAPNLVATQNGILVVDATDAQMDTMRQIVAELDVKSDQVQRTFELEYADPDDVKGIVESIVGDGTTPAAPTRGKRGAATAGEPAVRLVAYGNKLRAWASPEDMEQIAEIVAELDVPESQNELRSYEFAPGTNVTDLAQTLTRFFPSSGTTAQAQRRPSRRGGRPRTRVTPAASTADGGDTVMFVPQPSSRKIIVSAPPDMFEEIESTIDLLRPDAESKPVTVKFIDITNGDPADIAATIQPIVAIQEQELRAAGELPELEGKGATSSVVITPDTAANRLIVAAPDALMPKIESLVEELEAGEYGDRVMRTVELQNVDAQEMAQTIQAILAGRSAAPAAAPRSARGQRGRAGHRQAAPVVSASAGNVTVVPAPGGNALVLTGPSKDLDDVEGWIKQLDESGQIMKVYHLAHVDVEQLADEIMTIFDTQPPKQKKGGDDFDALLDFGGPRRGTDVSLTTDYISNTMIVWATPQKMQQIDELVKLYEDEGVAMKEELPSKIFPLKYADPFDAKYDLEDYIDVMWSRDKPTVDYLTWQNALVVRSRNKDDFDKIGDLINQYIDKPGEEQRTAMATKAIKGRSAADFAAMVMNNLAGKDIDVTIEGLPEEHKSLVPRLTPETDMSDTAPCVLPAILASQMDALAKLVTAQQKPTTTAPATEEASPTEAQPKAEKKVDSEDMVSKEAINNLVDQLIRQRQQAQQQAAEQKMPPQKQEEKTPADTEPAKPQLRIVVDPLTNSISFVGTPSAVAEAEDIYDKIEEEMKDKPALPDIRVYRLQYVAPEVASQVLQSMFNAGGPQAAGRLTPQQQAAQQRQVQLQMQRQLQAMRNQMRQAQGANAPEEGEDKDAGRRGRGEKDEQEEDKQQETISTQMTVFPYPSLNAIIVRAPTELYPAIEQLVATIDKKSQGSTEYKFFPIKNQLASDVEAQLKVIFNIDTEQSGRSRQPRVIRRGRNNTVDPAAQAVQELLQRQLDFEGMENAGSTENVTITSNNLTNTVLVRGPKQVLDLAEKIIDDIDAPENTPPHLDTRTYQLKYADATEVVPTLKTLFETSAASRRPGASGGDGGLTSGYHPDDVNAIFTADAANNSIIVRALEPDFAKIEPVIKMLDVESGQERVFSVPVIGDAVSMARTLESIYGMKGRRGRQGASAKQVQFVGDESSNTIFVSAPEDMQDEIRKRIDEMDQSAGEIAKPKFVALEHGDATAIARTIEEAFSAGRRKGNRRIQVTADEATKRLMVMCPDEMFPEVQELAKALDVPPNMTDLDIKVFSLKHARAGEVYDKMNALVQGLMRQLRGDRANLEPFSAQADERSNSIVVMGGPTTFALVKKVLDEIDVPEAAPVAVETRVLQLKKARASAVAQNIRQAFREKRGGVEPPEATADDSTNMLILRGTKPQLDEIMEKVIKPLDEFAEPAEAKLAETVLPLKYIQADEAAQYLTSWFNDRKKAYDALDIKGLRPSEFVVSITPEPASNQIVVMASKENVERIKQRLADIDREGLKSMRARETKIYPIKFADPNAVTNVIRGAFPTTRGEPEKDRVDVNVEWGTQSVVVTANEANQDAISKTIDDIDNESGAGQRVRKVYEMKNARASNVANMINQTLRQTRKTNRSGQLPVTVVPDDDLNVLIVSGTQKEYEDILPLIQELDQEPASETGLEVRVYPVNYVDPSSLIGTINNVFRTTGRTAPEDTVTASYTWGTSSLVVRASAENHKKIADLLKEVDVESAVQRTTHVLKLTEANAEEIAQRLTQIVQRTERRRREDQGMAIVADPSTNSLLVFANDSEFEKVKELVATLDVAPSVDKEIRAFKLTFADVGATRDAINQLFGRSQTRRLTPREEVAVVADWASNSVMVAAAPSRMKEIEGFIEEMDKSGTGGREVHVVTLKYADPDGVVRSLDDIFVRTTRGKQGETINVSHPQGSDSLLVRANDEEFKDIQAVIDQLDVLPADEDKSLQVVTLRYTDAEETKTILEDYLRKPGAAGGRGRGGAELMGNLRVTAVPSTNALVISGDQEGVDRVTDIVKKVDVEVTDGAGPRIIHLQKGIASEIEPLVTKVFTESTRGRGRGRSSAQMTPVIVADDTTNSLIVRAGAADYSLIERLVSDLDAEEGDALSRVRVVQVAAAFNVNDLAATIEQTMQQATPPSSSGRGGRQSGFSAQAVPASNTLVMAGDPKQLQVAEALVDQLQEMGPVGGMGTIILNTENLSAEDVQRVLQDVINQDSGSSRGSTTRRRPTTSNRRRR